MIYSLNYINM
jgi:class 3 adenylate cyclase